MLGMWPTLAVTSLSLIHIFNEISKEERNRLLMLFKKLPVTLNGPRGYNEAIITKGGIKAVSYTHLDVYKRQHSDSREQAFQ